MNIPYMVYLGENHRHTFFTYTDVYMLPMYTLFAISICMLYMLHMCIYICHTRICIYVTYIYIHICDIST